MGGRYLISGGQLGMIQSFLTPPSERGVEEPRAESLKLVKKIIDNQFIGESTLTIEQDVKMVSGEWI